MVFVAKHLRYAIPKELAGHMKMAWTHYVPVESDVLVIRVDDPRLLEGEEPLPDSKLKVRRMEGSANWFAGNLTVRERAE